MHRRTRGVTLITALLSAGVFALGAGEKGKSEPPKSTDSTTASEHKHERVAPKGAPNRPPVTTITGEVMDPACYLEAGVKSIGPGHFQCAVDCARSGQTLAIYDRANDRIYFIAGELPGKNPNVPLFPYIHQKVDVKGHVYHRSGAYGIVILRVAPHGEKPSKPAKAASAPTKETSGASATQSVEAADDDHSGH